MFDWWQSRNPLTEKSADEWRVGGFFGPHVILEELRSRIPRYLDEVDHGKLIYPACKRALSDLDGDVRSVWDHTRLEAMRYVTIVPKPEFELLSGADRQIEMMNAYLFQRPHDETVINFTGTATTDFSIAILARLNWLTHCLGHSKIGITRDLSSHLLPGMQEDAAHRVDAAVQAAINRRSKDIG